MFKGRILSKIDRIISKSITSQIIWLLAVIVAVYALLVIVSLLTQTWLSGETFTLRFWNITSHFLNPGSFYREGDGNTNWLIFIINMSGMVLFGGILISILSNMIERRVEKVKNGEVYYKFRSHILIVGYNKMVVGIINQIGVKYPQSKIIIQTAGDVSSARQELMTHIAGNLENQIIFISGNRIIPDDLEKLCLPCSEEIFILGESNEQDHDSQNIDCLKRIHFILAKEKSCYKRCNVLFENQSTYAVFQQQDIDEIKICIDFVPFNFYESWASKVFIDNNYFSNLKSSNLNIDYSPLDREPITENSEKSVHLVILGMSEMGIRLGIQAALMCHFPNYHTKGIKTRITFVDENADVEMSKFKFRYPNLFDEIDSFFHNTETAEKSDNTQLKSKFTDIEMEFVKGRIENSVVQNLFLEWANRYNSLMTIAVCFSNAEQAMSAGLYLPNVIYDKEIPVLVKQENSCALVAMLSLYSGNNIYRKYKCVKPFGMIENCYNINQADDKIPMMINYVYDHYYQTKQIPDTFPNNEMESLWRKLSTSLKWSNIYNSGTIKVKQRSFSINPDKIIDDETLESMSVVEHNRWVIEKLLMGYRAPTEQENEIIRKDKTQKNYYKKRFVHFDISAYDDLEDDASGSNVKEYDRCISVALPSLIQELEVSQNTIAE